MALAASSSNVLNKIATKVEHTHETLRSAARQSEAIHLIPLSLRRAIKKFLRERDMTHMNRKVLQLSQSFTKIKDVNLQLYATTSRELIEDPIKSVTTQSGKWKIRSEYGDIGLKYQEDQTIAYVASRMPAVYCACFRVLKEVRRRLPGFSPSKVLDFGAGPGSALWAMREVWPQSLKHVNLVEPSKEMQRTAQSLLADLKELPVIHSYDSIQALNRELYKHERPHDLVISSYALGEIASLSDRITIVRQLWNLTGDVLILLEPGSPQGSKIIQQMRSYILWMAKRKCRKTKNKAEEVFSEETSIAVGTAKLKNGAFVVAPCPHDGKCPLENTNKYCHFVQRLERTSSQRAYKRSKGEPLRGYEDEKFCFVALRRGQRPVERWPLDGMKFETLKEQHAKRNPDELIIEYEDRFSTESDEEECEDSVVRYASDMEETGMFHEEEVDEEQEDNAHADLGGGWGRIIYSPFRRGRLVQMDVCRSTKRDGSEGAFQRVAVTKSKNPVLHQQASSYTASTEKGDADKQEEKSDLYSNIMTEAMGAVLTYKHELGMNYNFIQPDLIVGSCLQTPSDVDKLRNIGVTILCLQQDADLEYFGVDIGAIQRYAQECKDMDHIRAEIRDFDAFDLRMRLPVVVSILDKAIKPNGGVTYIHCTAGLGQAPTTALAYMFWVQDYKRSEAIKLLMSKRPCFPKLEAIKNATADIQTGLSKKRVTLTWKGDNCSSVEISGLDIGWGQRIPLKFDSETRSWTLDRDLPEGRYEYKYIVNGEWTCNKSEAITVPNGDGHVNNYVKVPSSTSNVNTEELRRRVTSDMFTSQQKKG